MTTAENTTTNSHKLNKKPPKYREMTTKNIFEIIRKNCYFQ